MMRAELEHSKKIIHEYKNALDQSSIVVITDPAGNISYVNDKFCEISKYSRDELIGNTHRVVNSGYHTKNFFTDLWLTIASGKVWRGEFKNRAKDGSFYWVETTIVPFIDATGKIDQYVSIRTDISEKKAAESLVEEERARVIHAEKMASLGEMAAEIAHELGNPLASVSSWFDVVVSQVEKGQTDVDKVIEMIPVAKEKISHMKNIIRGMLTYARDGSSDPYESVNLARVINDVLEYCAYRMKKDGVICEFYSDDDISEVECRETEIAQVLVNLIMNSCDAVQNLSKKWIRIELKKAANGVGLSVIDSGLGISDDIRSQILKPFYSTKPKGKGNGLGLSISNSIVLRHGGILDIRQEAKNTCFDIWLPNKQLT